MKTAQFITRAASPTVVDEFLAQNADIAANVKQQLDADAARVGGVRLLPGRFMVIEQAIGLPASRGEPAAQALAAFVESANGSGFVARALQRHNIQGAVAAPARRSVCSTLTLCADEGRRIRRTPRLHSERLP